MEKEKNNPILLSYSILPILVVLPIRKAIKRQKTSVVKKILLLISNANATPAKAEWDIPTPRKDSFLSITNIDKNPKIILINIPAIVVLINISVMVVIHTSYTFFIMDYKHYIFAKNFFQNFWGNNRIVFSIIMDGFI